MLKTKEVKRAEVVATYSHNSKHYISQLWLINVFNVQDRMTQLLCCSNLKYFHPRNSAFEC